MVVGGGGGGGGGGEFYNDVEWRPLGLWFG